MLVHRRCLSAFASERHYLDHLAPTWLRVPAERRHRFIVPERLEGHAQAVGITDLHLIPDRFTDADVRALCDHPANVTLVASYGNVRPLLGLPTVFCEHGVGQTFRGVSHPAYADSPQRKGVELFLAPNSYAARAVRSANPDARVEVVGIPRLDEWHTRPAKKPVRTVALTFHWRCRVIREASPALDHYEPGLREFVKLARRHKVKLLGHGHPLIWGELEPLWRSLRVERVKDSTEVLERADVLVADCTSFIYEFASLDRPVVLLDAPWYRRGVEHGLRFWDAADVGVRIAEPDQLWPAVERALEDPPEVAEARRDAVGRVVPFRDGGSARRAAAAIMRHVL